MSRPSVTKILGLPVLIGSLTLMGACALLPQGLGPFGSGASGGATATAPGAPAAPLDHSALARVLERYVDAEGLVDYRGLQQDPSDLNTYVAELAALPAASVASWSEAERIALLINAYNALTLAAIIEHDPLKGSIRDIWGVWNLRRHTVAGEPMTLDHLEHGILRKEYNEPRIHAALVCAANSCPPLRREPFRGEQLDAQLDNQVDLWLSGPHGLKIDRDTNTVAISKIFEWFAEDWDRTYRTDKVFGGHPKQSAVLNFISQHSPPADRLYLNDATYRFTYLDYDWALNSQRQSPG